MGDVIKYLNRIVAAGVAVVTISLPLAAQQDRLDGLLADLAMAPPQEAQRIAAEIEMEWAKSGSAAMDLLLRRGEDALEAGDLAAAVEHLSAAIDHAPDFAEAWHLRSIAFFRQERFGLALHDIEQTLAREPRHFNAIYGLGVLLDEMGRPDLAREALLRAQSIHPHHKDISGTLERVSRKLGGADL